MSFLKSLAAAALACASVAQAATFDVKFSAEGDYFHDFVPTPVTGSFKVETDDSLGQEWWAGEVQSFEMTINGYAYSSKNSGYWSWFDGFDIWGATNEGSLAWQTDDFILQYRVGQLPENSVLIIQVPEAHYPFVASSVSFEVTAVPEVSTLGLASAGLLIAGIAGRRRMV